MTWLAASLLTWMVGIPLAVIALTSLIGFWRTSSMRRWLVGYGLKRFESQLRAADSTVHDHTPRADYEPTMTDPYGKSPVPRRA